MVARASTKRFLCYVSNYVAKHSMEAYLLLAVRRCRGTLRRGSCPHSSLSLRTPKRYQAYLLDLCLMRSDNI